MEPSVKPVTLLQFIQNEEECKFEVNKDSLDTLTALINDQESDEMQPIGIVSIVGQAKGHNSKLIKNIFDKVRFSNQSETETIIQLWPEPVDVIDQYGTNVKAYVLN